MEKQLRLTLSSIPIVIFTLLILTTLTACRTPVIEPVGEDDRSETDIEPVGAYSTGSETSDRTYEREIEDDRSETDIEPVGAYSTGSETSDRTYEREIEDDRPETGIDPMDGVSTEPETSDRTYEREIEDDRSEKDIEPVGAYSTGSETSDGTYEREIKDTVSKADSEAEVDDHRAETLRRHRRQPSGLKAGETDDNKDWQEYLDYRDRYSGPPFFDYPVRTRTIIEILHPGGIPAHDMPVTIKQGRSTIFKGRSYADGRVMFFPEDDRASRPFTIHIKGNKETFIEKVTPSYRPTSIVIDETPPRMANQPLDVLFLLDSTGSMADEINKIKSTLLSISHRVADLPSSPDLRFAMVSYRDRDDDYVTRIYDFDSNVNRFSNTIRDVAAHGGGDYPESLNEAFHKAVNVPEWRERDTVRLIILIADAPPHLDYGQDHSYATQMERARENGIKVHTIATSGLDEQGEYIFRQIAQNTLGKFIYILYQEGPQGELKTPHDVKPTYQPQHLDNLVVNLIQEELKHFSPRRPRDRNR